MRRKLTPEDFKVETFASVWDAICDSPEEAANLRARADLMHGISDIVKAAGWTEAEAARRCGLTQPRMSNLVHGEISSFSLDALVNIATALGQRVELKLSAA